MRRETYQNMNEGEQSFLRAVGDILESVAAEDGSAMLSSRIRARAAMELNRQLQHSMTVRTTDKLSQLGGKTTANGGDEEYRSNKQK